MSGEVRLMPCPFCEGKAEITQYGDASKSTIYQCTECGCRLETGESFNHGRRWNERPMSINLRNVIAKGDRIEMHVATDIAKIMAQAFLDLLDQQMVVNYLGMEVHDQDGRGVLVTVQRLERPTAHELRLEAEAKLAALIEKQSGEDA